MKTKTGLPALWFSGLILGLAAQGALADVTLPALLSDHMVLQAKERVLVWGWAQSQEEVFVEIDGQRLARLTDGKGQWRVRLKPMEVGRHLSMIVRGANQIVVNDVLTGEVWLGAGQSNMELPVTKAKNFQQEQAAAEFPQIRMFTVGKRAGTNALEDVTGHWEVCTSNTIGNFSAALYFFGREIHQRLGVPVGLINSSWGGTPIQPWMPLGALQAYPGYAALLERKQAEIASWPAREKQLQAALRAWEIAASEAKAAGKAGPPKPWNPGPPDSGQYMPGQLYNAMIHPLLHYRIRGAIWYQGEANAGGGRAGAADYTDLQSRMIAGWRADWGIGHFPFFFVQLPNWENDSDRSQASWAFFREGQANVLKAANTGMAVTIDIGEADNIHPRNKQEVGRRLALLALSNVYRQRVVCQGPQFWRYELSGAKVRIRFRHADGGLMAHGGALKGFAVAGDDKSWHPAYAGIDGEAVLVSSPDVPQPVAVRYAWGNNPEGNLYNGAGLPACPFRTDR